MSDFVTGLVNRVNADENIQVRTGVDIADVRGFVGNFETTLSSGEVIPHGVTVIATGALEYKPTEYLYGQNDSVMTLLELESLLADKDSKVTGAKNVAFIQCVGSRDAERPYCSRICCVKSVKQALKVKELNPDANVFVLYRDIRTYGFTEEMYKEARQKGVIFIRYTVDNKPVIKAGANGVECAPPPEGGPRATPTSKACRPPSRRASRRREPSPASKTSVRRSRHGRCHAAFRDRDSYP